MAVAAVLADDVEIRLQTFEVLGIVLRRLDVGGEFGDCRLEVVHSLPDHRSRGGLGAGFRTIRKQRRHLLGVFGKGRVNFLHLGGVERHLALDYCRADLRLFTALFHQGLPLLDELRTALRRGRSHSEQKNSESNDQFAKHGATSSWLISSLWQAVPYPVSSPPIQPPTTTLGPIPAWEKLQAESYPSPFAPRSCHTRHTRPAIWKAFGASHSVVYLGEAVEIAGLRSLLRLSSAGERSLHT